MRMEKIERLEKKSVEIRKQLIETISKNGGHLGPNLGVVELTLALHEVFDFDQDKILFDVGHQSYVHKILTGRGEKFDTLRKLNGVGPFSDPKESKADNFIAGHAGSALSAAAGIAKANLDKKVVVVIGDASIANGHSLEALNYIGESLKNVIIVLNDNGMSIGKNVGAISKFLGRVMISGKYLKFRKGVREIVNTPVRDVLERMENSTKQFFLPPSVLESLGYRYFGLVNGHNFDELLTIFERVKNINSPILVHIKTEKGKGYGLAEENKEKFHGVSPFNLDTGETVSGSETYSNIFGKKIVELGEKDQDLYTISAAMIKGTGLAEFQHRYPDRCIDVGIAEGHAVTFAGGLAISGKNPYVAIYSTFFQRALDQIIHDIGLQDLSVKFIVDRAGIVGEDGKTHQGIHDIDIFLTMPNYSVFAPTTGRELEKILEATKGKDSGAVAIRFPRGATFELERDLPFTIGKWTEIEKGEKNLYLATGSMLKEIMLIKDRLEELGYGGTIVNCSSIRPLDEKFLLEELPKYDNIFTLEEGLIRGGFGNEVLKFLNRNGILKKVNIIGFEDAIIPHGNRDELLELYSLRGDSLIERIKREIVIK